MYWSNAFVNIWAYLANKYEQSVHVRSIRPVTWATVTPSHRPSRCKSRSESLVPGESRPTEPPIDIRLTRGCPEGMPCWRDALSELLQRLMGCDVKTSMEINGLLWVSPVSPLVEDELVNKEPNKHQRCHFWVCISCPTVFLKQICLLSPLTTISSSTCCKRIDQLNCSTML